MKKLRIKDEEQLRNAIKIIIIAILSIIVTIIIANYFRANGFDSLFTTNVYKEAFERNPNDIILINRIEAVLIIGILALVPSELKYNKELQELKREEEELCK